MADNAQLIAQCTARAKEWLSPAFDEETRKEVQAMLDAEDKTALIDAFYQNLEFGTGGLRGIMGAGTNRMNKYIVGMATQGFANYILKAFPGRKDLAVVVGHDCRNNGRMFAESVAAIFSANGIKAYLFESLRPTPEISFAIRQLGAQAGVNVTASHNPREYNGYKAYWDDGAQVLAPHDVGIIEEVNKVTIDQVKFEPNYDLIEIIGGEMDWDYRMSSCVKKTSTSFTLRCTARAASSSPRPCVLGASRTFTSSANRWRSTVTSPLSFRPILRMLRL